MLLWQLNLGTAGPGYRTESHANASSVSIAPVAGDYFVVFTAYNAAALSPTCSDDNGGTYTRVGTASYYIGGTATLAVFVRDQLLPNGTSTTVSISNYGSATSFGTDVLAFSGMPAGGIGQVRSSGKEENQTSGSTPAPSLSQNALTTSITVGVVATPGASGITPPGSWTERADFAFLETVTRDSGFTGTTITWGASVSNYFADYVLELDTNPPVPALSDTQYPPLVRRPFFGAHLQHAQSWLDPSPTPVPPTPTAFPEAVRRPSFGAAWQLAEALPSQPERTAPIADVQWPDFARRGVLAVASQLAVAPRPEQQVVSLDAVFPETVRRPAFPVMEQLGAAALPPRPERTLPDTDVSWPDFARRPFFGAVNQLAATELSPRPERTSPLATGVFPDRAPRAVFGMWLSPSPTTEPSTPPITVVVPTEGYVEFPSFVLRPRVPTSAQLAVTELSPQPERQAPLADVEWPDFARRPAFAAARQLASTEETPAPERTSPLAWVSFADRVDRPIYAASNQRAYTDATFTPTPYLNATGLSVSPDAVLRPKYAAALQQAYADPTATTFLAQFIQKVGIGWHPDAVYRPKFASALQLPEVEPRRERTSALADVQWPDFAHRATMPTAEQPYASAANTAPERTLASFDVGFPDFARKPFLSASSQPFVSSANIRPERQVVAFDVLFPEAVRRPTYQATEQLAATEIPPAPERTSTLADVWYPASVRRPFLASALQLAASEETPAPVSDLAPKLSTVEFPASVRRPALHASQQLDSVMPWARAVQSALPVPYSDAEYPAYLWRAWSPTNHPALSSGIAVFDIATAPNGRSVTGFPTGRAGIEERSAQGVASVPTAHPSVRVRVSNGSIVVRTNTSRVKE